MPRTIWRFALPITDEPTVEMPAGAEVLSVATGRGPENYAHVDIEMWASVDPATPTERRAFRVVGTGNPLPADVGRFVGTVPTHGGALIWHVFEAAGASHPDTKDTDR